ncbi:hypothetical protein [Cryobacterium sinapicolor]|uniref:hypothetical protein n=1 Tax=Cryobacterium sinapicolor TaxID=1259236 RepID=UPI00141AB689|nr:hypothetical protein [Cryobacterium sinapicolor]
MTSRDQSFAQSVATRAADIQTDQAARLARHAAAEERPAPGAATMTDDEMRDLRARRNQ